MGSRPSVERMESQGRIHVKERRREVSASAEARRAKFEALDRNAKFDIAWRLAWENGHACGLSEVESFFNDLAPLLKP